MSELIENRRRGADPLIEQILIELREAAKTSRDMHGHLTGLQHDMASAVNQRATMFLRLDKLDVGMAQLAAASQANADGLDKLSSDLREHMDGEGDAIKIAVREGIGDAINNHGLGEMKDTEGKIRTADEDLRGMRAFWHRMVDVGKAAWRRIVQVLAALVIGAGAWVLAQAGGIDISKIFRGG